MDEHTNANAPVDNTGNAGASNADTPSEPVAGNSGNQEPSKEAPKQDSDSKSSGKGEIDWEKRYSDSTREAGKLMAERDAERQRAEEAQMATLKFVTKDRGTFEQYLDHQGTSGVDKERLMKWYDTEYKAENESQPASDNNDAMANMPKPKLEDIVDPTTKQFLEQGRNQLDQKMKAQNEAWMKFVNQPEAKGLKQNELQAIGMLAKTLDDNYGYTPEEAIAEASRRILNVNSIRDEGYAEGMKDSSYLSSKAGPGIAGSNQKTESNDSLPGHHERFVRQEIERKRMDSEQAKAYREQYRSRLNRKNG